MHWAPATLCSDLTSGSTASGVYIVDRNLRIEYIITLADVLHNSLVEGKALGTVNVNVNKASWEELKLQHALPLSHIEETLNSMSRDFSLNPSRSLKLLVFTFVAPCSEERLKCASNDLILASPQISGSHVQLSTTPFGVSHLNLFHGYRSAGTVSLVLKDLILVDARYLDSMEGGLALDADDESVLGLIAGHLVHNRKRGSFVPVVPWETLMVNLRKVIPNFPSPSAPAKVQLGTRTFKGVVSVRIQLKPSIISWGSGVLVGADTVVTNYHVVRDKTVDQIEICLENDKRTASRVAVKIKNVVRPNKNLDLVLLQLQSKVDTTAFPPVTLATKNPKAGTKVKSIGYGLFLPGRYGDVMVPLESNGLISQSLEHIMICSASCWNGSSGGGVFDAKTNSLVGIMSSNATDNATGESMPDIAFVIPITALLKAMAPSGAENTDSDIVSRLYKLDRTHKDQLTSKL